MVRQNPGAYGGINVGTDMVEWGHMRYSPMSGHTDRRLSDHRAPNHGRRRLRFMHLRFISPRLGKVM